MEMDVDAKHLGSEMDVDGQFDAEFIGRAIRFVIHSVSLLYSLHVLGFKTVS